MSNIIRQNVNYGLNQPLNLQNPNPIIAKRDPNGADHAPIGQEWVNTVSNAVFFETSIVNNVANWVNVAGGAGVFSSLTVNPGPTNLSTVGNGAVTIGNAANTGAITLSSGTGNISILGNGNTLHIGDDNALGTDVFLGSTNAGSGTQIDGGQFVAISTQGPAAATLTMGSLTGTGIITLGQSTAGQTIDIGNAINTVAQVINIAAGASGANSTVNILTGNGTAGTQTFNALTGTRAGAVNIGSGAAAHQIVIGSVNTTSTTTIHAGATGNIFLDANSSNISMTMLTGSIASPTATIILNARVGQATFTGFTTAAAGAQVFTITNSTVTAASAILVSAANFGANDAQMTVTRVIPGAGTFNVTLTNYGAAALNGDVVINFWVYN